MTEGEHSMEDRARIFAPVLAQVKRLADEGKPVAIAIDGRCGSGKTWLSGLIGDRFPCNILHMDDFYLPFGRRAQGWEAVPGGNMDFRRLRDELLIPIRAGEAAVYRAYLCPEDRFGEARLLPVRNLTVVEGSYSRHPSVGEAYDLTIFLTCSREVQRRRLAQREGSRYAAFKERWIPMEENYFRCFDVEGTSHMVVDTGGAY
nr:uridine kinase [uncultured Acetatifactor sp.]